MLIHSHNSIFVDWKQIALNLCNSLLAYCWIDLLVSWFKGIIPSYYAFFFGILILELNLRYWPYIIYMLCWCCSGWQLLDNYFVQSRGGGGVKNCQHISKTIKSEVNSCQYKCITDQNWLYCKHKALKKWDWSDSLFLRFCTAAGIALCSIF